MLKISIDFTIDKFLSEFPEYEDIWDYMDDEPTIRCRGMSFVINGKDFFSTDTVYPVRQFLLNINNGFYDLLKCKNNDVVKIFLDELGLRHVLSIKKDYDKIIILSIVPPVVRPYQRPFYDFFSSKGNISIDLIQAFEEVIRAVNQYKDIFWQAANKLVSDNVFRVMNIMFGKEEKYTKKYYDDPNFDWIKFVKEGDKLYKIQDDRPLIIHKLKSEEEFYDYHKKAKDNKHETKRHIVINDFYWWLPLETAWNEYKKEHKL